MNSDEGSGHLEFGRRIVNNSRDVGEFWIGHVVSLAPSFLAAAFPPSTDIEVVVRSITGWVPVASRSLPSLPGQHTLEYGWLFQGRVPVRYSDLDAAAQDPRDGAVLVVAAVGPWQPAATSGG